MKQSKEHFEKDFQNKIESFLSDSYFDVQSMSATKLGLNETQIVRLVTKISVGLVTVWWSSLELKTLLKTYKLSKG
jgi:hypothetical protein